MSSLVRFDGKRPKNSTGIQEFKVKTKVFYKSGEEKELKELNEQTINYKIFKKMSGIKLGGQQVFHLTIVPKNVIGYCYFAKDQPILKNNLIINFFKGKTKELEKLKERLDNAVKLPKPKPNQNWIDKNPNYEPVDETDVKWINTEMNFLYNSFLEYLYTLGVDSNDLLLSLFPDGTDKITTYDDVIIENKEVLFQKDKENFTIQSLFEIFIKNTQNDNPLIKEFRNRIDEIKETIDSAIKNDLTGIFFKQQETEIRNEIGEKNSTEKIDYLKEKYKSGFIEKIVVVYDVQYGASNHYIEITFKLTEKEQKHTFDIKFYPTGTNKTLEQIKKDIETIIPPTPSLNFYHKPKGTKDDKIKESFIQEIENSTDKIKFFKDKKGILTDIDIYHSRDFGYFLNIKFNLSNDPTKNITFIYEYSPEIKNNSNTPEGRQELENIKDDIMGNGSAKRKSSSATKEKAKTPTPTKRKSSSATKKQQVRDQPGMIGQFIKFFTRRRSTKNKMNLAEPTPKTP